MASGPLVAAVTDDKVMVVLIYRQNTPMEELLNRLDVTMTDTIRLTYLQEYTVEEALETIFKHPTE